MNSTRTQFCVAALLTTLSLTGCDSSSTPGATGSPAPSTQITTTTQPATSSSTSETAGSAAPSTLTTTTTAPGTSSGASQSATGASDLATKGCAAIKLADVQAVVKATVTKVEFDPGSAELDPTHSFECSVNNPTLLITVHPEDSSKQTYDEDLAAENVPAVPLPGVGESAAWTAVSMTPGIYTDAPDLYAHQGDITCEIQGNGAQWLKIPAEPGLAGGVTKANAAAFAAKLGVLCNDVFAALT